MFISDQICILTAGIAVNGKEISQQIIDEMAESYNPSVYTARIKKTRCSSAMRSALLLR